MNHIVTGCIFPFLLAAGIYLFRRGRASLALLIGTPLAMVACATWAVLPDLPRTFGFSGFDQRYSSNPGLDIFFWHYTVNLHETAVPWLFNAVFVLMVIALFSAAWRELARAEGT